MKFKIKYEDETVKIADIRLKESQIDIDGFLLAVRVAPTLYDKSNVLLVEKMRNPA